MTGGATSLTSESPCQKPTRHGARGPGAVVGGLIVPYVIFFSLSALIPEKAKRTPADMPTSKSC